ncbi:hypothetical protein CAPTEDRAFT_55121, partial [Capitella teleta]|uniref:GTP-binding protein n=1 Tax=Capitella teleta TaxID=283909 RepID=X2B606_CAPTE
DVTYKVLLLGDTGVGKTALIRSLTGTEFKANHLTTVGIDFVKKTFDADGALVQLQIWDTAGQERFRSLTKFQYRSTKGLLLVYDVTDRTSFETLGYWLDSIDSELDRNNKEPVPVFIVGNKTDLEESRVVSTQEGKKAAESHYVHGFLETSAKNGHNVSEAFNKLADAI